MFYFALENVIVNRLIASFHLRSRDFERKAPVEMYKCTRRIFCTCAHMKGKKIPVTFCWITERDKSKFSEQATVR